MNVDRSSVEAAWLALLSTDGMSPRRLWEIAIGGESVVDVARRLADAEPAEVHRRHLAAGVGLTLHGDAGHPNLGAPDPHVPPVLLWRGAGGAGRPAAPAVGIIGTRRASRAGLDIAREFGRELAGRGCVVVSGLALGVDAAAHRGALEADGGGVVAVVGSGLDVVYPRANRSLWHDVSERGSLVSEYVLGTPPAAWRFPARNRILVALCDALVVVESHERGGSLITADIAGARGVPVLAVPGAIRSPTAVGTNRLIADGCQPCLGVDDVLEAIGLVSAPTLPFGPPPGAAGVVTAATPAEEALLDAVGWAPCTFDEAADVCPHLTLAELAMAAASLLARDVLVQRDGRLERIR